MGQGAGGFSWRADGYGLCPVKHGLDIWHDVQLLPCIKVLLSCFETLVNGRNVPIPETQRCFSICVAARYGHEKHPPTISLDNSMIRLPLVSIFLASQSVMAAEPTVEYQCPQLIMTTQALVTPLSGWSQSTEQPSTTDDKKFRNHSENYLETVTFSEGIPENRATLIPDNESETVGKVWDARWNFERSEII